MTEFIFFEENWKQHGDNLQSILYIASGGDLRNIA